MIGNDPIRSRTDLLLDPESSIERCVTWKCKFIGRNGIPRTLIHSSDTSQALTSFTFYDNDSISSNKLDAPFLLYRVAIFTSEKVYREKQQLLTEVK